jgi:alanine racemase
MSNSACIFTWGEAHLNIIRPGIMTYGSSPFKGRTGACEGLRAVMTLKAPLIAKHTIGKGQSIGYSATYVCPEDTVTGVVGAGYADGYPRHAPTGTPVFLNGKRTRLLGRVSMDMIVIDLTGIEAEVGDLVEMWGSNVSVD